ncbi:hypothetical protein GGI42DRAFT_80065 [Trichoderma sp. SZMC 28013]
MLEGHRRISFRLACPRLFSSLLFFSFLLFFGFRFALGNGLQKNDFFVLLFWFPSSFGLRKKREREIGAKKIRQDCYSLILGRFFLRLFISAVCLDWKLGKRFFFFAMASSLRLLLPHVRFLFSGFFFSFLGIQSC